MSLELAIQENTKAIQTLIATFAALPAINGTIPAVTVADIKPTGKAAKPEVKKEDSAPIAEPEAKVETEALKEEEEAKTEAEVSVITLDDLTKKFTTFVKTNGKDAAVALLTSYGVAKLSLLPADKYAEFEAELGA